MERTEDTEPSDLLLAPGETAEDWAYDRGNPQGSVRWSFVQAQRRIGFELGVQAERRHWQHVARELDAAAMDVSPAFARGQAVERSRIALGLRALATNREAAGGVVEAATMRALADLIAGGELEGGAEDR